MKISDKELDDLFQSKLNNLETEPDARVWNNISAQLNIKPKKKSIIMSILQIAASMVIVFSAGWLLLRQNDQLVKKPLPQKVVKLELKRPPTAIQESESLVKKKVLLLSAKNKVIKEAWTSKRKHHAIALKPEIGPEQDDASTQTLAQNKQEQDLQKSNITQSRIAVVPDIATSLNVQPENETPVTTPVKPPVLAVKRSMPVTVAKHKGIRTVGDLVNLVMAKVDKRQDKLIEFTDSDDGEESNITGINLGIISLKKEK
ncbi:hypothetical protein [Mucilaginibacter arboris]|uniref:Uncharacterized protein n=1 Tax=Mucilaginibacter arboris TaxID=2682090 RepID=A0A7K1STF5_9SPHI|nr:hypothetical protein [Mucilaginibacter arboris]MVN20593.1 hypothetical protein [Mucilaginibacter arboris]